MDAVDMCRHSRGIPPGTGGAVAAALFEADPTLQILGVVVDDRPVGLITREHLFSVLSQPFGRELWSRRAVQSLMNAEPRLLPASTPIEDIGRFISESAPEVLREGIAFIDEEGRFAGAASGLDLYSAAVQMISSRNRDLVDLNRNLMAEKQESARANSASRAKSEFLATVSHEIRTPLNGILGVAQALMLDAHDPEQKEKLGLIAHSGQTLLQLLNDILDLAKIEAGRMDISPVDADLGEILKRACGVFEPLAADKGIKLILSIAPDLPARLRFDPLRVHQCVANLVSNAVKFTETGAVRVTCRMDEAAPNRVVIDITDTGIGIAPGSLALLFSDFTQVDASTTRRFAGTGLGLSISRKLARMMHGDITARSVQGVGSVFTLTLTAQPVTSAAAPTPAPGAPPRSVLQKMEGLRILIVDDNAINRQVLKLFLAELRAHLTEASNGREALELMAANAFDLVLMDVNMPVMDGEEAVRRIRAGEAGARRLPVFALTADAMAGDGERLLRAGMSDYISKPIDRGQLLTRMARSLALDDAASSPVSAAR